MKYIRLKLILQVLFVYFIFNNNVFASQNDYDLICDTFKDSAKWSDYNTLTRDERITRINQKIWSEIKTKEAKEIMSAIASASADLKYKLFKESVELVTGSEWECPAMRDY